MHTNKPKLTRKDRCHLVGKRAGMLNYAQAIKAWYHLSGWIENMGHPASHPTPKFNELLHGVRKATIHGKRCKL